MDATAHASELRFHFCIRSSAWSHACTRTCSSTQHTIVRRRNNRIAIPKIIATDSACQLGDAGAVKGGVCQGKKQALRHPCTFSGVSREWDLEEGWKRAPRSGGTPARSDEVVEIYTSTALHEAWPAQRWPAHQAAEMMTATGATTAVTAVAHAVGITEM